MENGIYEIGPQRAIEVKDGKARGLLKSNRHVKVGGVLHDQAFWTSPSQWMELTAPQAAALATKARSTIAEIA